MWSKRGWICLGISAAATFGLTLISFYPSSATAKNPAPAPRVITSPTLTSDGVSITASIAESKAVQTINNIAYSKPGPLPRIEVRASNQSDSTKTIRLSATIAETDIASMLSRVPMPRNSRPSQWTQVINFDIKPNETKTFQISTDAKLGTRSFATLRLQAGSETIEALTISSMPAAPRAIAKSIPATRPSNDVAVADPKATR